MNNEEAAYQLGEMAGRVIGTVCVLAIFAVIGVTIFFVIKALGNKKPPA